MPKPASTRPAYKMLTCIYLCRTLLFFAPYADFLKKVYNYEASPNDWKFEGSRPAIVDFYATWCGPCKVMHPILEELSKEYSGKVDIYQIDVDKEQDLAAAFGIRSIPTLLMIPMKEEPRIMQGAMPKDQLKKAIDEFLLKQNNEAKQ